MYIMGVRHGKAQATEHAFENSNKVESNYKAQLVRVCYYEALFTGC